MGRKKGGNNRQWTNDQRLKYVLLCVENHIPVRQVARENNIPYGTLNGWVRKYQMGGVQTLNPEKLRCGNRFSALHTSKSLSEIDRLRLLVEKLEIENERLKKGYIVKGVGVNKEFVTLKEWNSRL